MIKDGFWQLGLLAVAVKKRPQRSILDIWIVNNILCECLKYVGTCMQHSRIVISFQSILHTAHKESDVWDLGFIRLGLDFFN